MFEDGSDYVDALKIKVHSLKELKEVCKAIKDADKPYKFITIDTVTAIEEMAKPVAITLYQSSPQYSDKYSDIKDPALLPNGMGWNLWRTAVESIINLVASCADNLIICGHVKDAKLDENASGNLRTLAVMGKLSRILSAKSDAIGWVHRDEDSNLCIKFGQDGEVLTGARPQHLANKDIIVAERNEDGTFTPHWERIYPSLANNN